MKASILFMIRLLFFSAATLIMYCSLSFNGFNTTDMTHLYSIGSSQVNLLALKASLMNSASRDAQVPLIKPFTLKARELNKIIQDDFEAPTVNIPNDITISCYEDIADTKITGTITYKDNCTNINNIEALFIDKYPKSFCSKDAHILRVFIVKDEVGNTTIDTQRITQLDNNAPVFDFNQKLFDAIPIEVSDTISCEEEFLAPIKATASDSCSEAIIKVDTLTRVPKVCSGYQVNYRYIATDACMNSDTVYSGFWVSSDTISPQVIALDSFIQLNTDPGVCQVTTTVPIPTVVDNCSNYIIANSINGEDTLTTTFPLGETTFSYTITDDCGNITVVDQTVNVVDKEKPELICLKEPLQVNISTGMTIVYSKSFIIDVTDNCSEVDIKVRRLNDLCNVTGNQEFGDSLFFCTADIGSIQKIEIIATDHVGNQNKCIALAEVSDLIQPSFLIPIPDITVSATYPLDLNNLDQLGTFVLTGNERSEIYLDDTAYVSSKGFIGQDGVYKENCPIGTTVNTEVVDMTTNGLGTIMRIFTITDPSNNSASYTQKILIKDYNPFSEDDISWPKDIHVEACENNIPTVEEVGFPKFINTSKVHDIQFSNKDSVFDDPPSGCVYIRRTFQVIDKNVYNQNLDPDKGIWSRTQDIYITNNIAPQFDEHCRDTLICAEGFGCSALVEYSVSATDDCSQAEDLVYNYTIDINNNRVIDLKGVGNTISELLPQGIHKVTYTVSDPCGNVESCSRFLEVKECKAPTAECIALAVDLSPIDGTVEVWANEFNVNSFDNCTDSENLLFSFSPNTKELGRQFDCDSIGLREVQIWVTDESGNQSYSTTTIDIQDNSNACGNSIPHNTLVMGYVATQHNMPLSNTTIVIDGAELNDNIITDEIGEYVFSEIPMYNDYVITPTKDDEHLRGVSTMDLVLIEKHILSIEELSSPYDIIAADVNASRSITETDIDELRRMILGVQDEFNSNESFRFVESTYVFDDDREPFHFVEEVEFSEIDRTKVQSDFVAIKIGDVNGSIEDGLVAKSNFSMTIYTDDQYLETGETIVIPIYTDNLSSLVGLQFTIDYDSDYLEFVSADGGQIALEGKQVEDHKNVSKTTMAWSTFKAKSNLNMSEPLAYFAYSVKRNGKLKDVWSISSDITQAIAYDGNYQKHDIALKFKNTSAPGFAMFQNQPNPFTEYTEVLFELPKAEDVSLNVFDNNGKLVHRQSARYMAGKHQIRLNTEQLTQSGVYYYKIKAGEYSDARKMLKIK